MRPRHIPFTSFRPRRTFRQPITPFGVPDFFAAIPASLDKLEPLRTHPNIVHRKPGKPNIPFRARFAHNGPLTNALKKSRPLGESGRGATHADDVKFAETTRRHAPQIWSISVKKFWAAINDTPLTNGHRESLAGGGSAAVNTTNHKLRSTAKTGRPVRERPAFPLCQQATFAAKLANVQAYYRNRKG